MFLKTEERPQGEQQKVGALKLSEAIRIGAKLRPQAHDWSISRSCALMAGYEGQYGHMPKSWSVVNTYTDEFLRVPNRVSGQAMVMNDDQKKSREEIADWLESQGY